MTPQDLTIFFVVQRGPLSLRARLLALSIRKFLDPNINVRAAIPYDFPEPNRDTLIAMEHLGVELKYFTPTLANKYQYKIGNKLDASLLDIDTRYAMFVDTDTLFLRSPDWEPVFRNDPDLSAQNIMGRGAYTGETGLAFRKYAEEKFGITTQPYSQDQANTAQDVCGFPLYNSGAVLFRTDTDFAESWYQTTTEIWESDLPEKLKRPYADQSSLAILAASKKYNTQLLPKDWNVHPSKPRNTTLVHYFNMPTAMALGHIGRVILQLREVGISQGFDPMEEWAGRDVMFFKEMWQE